MPDAARQCLCPTRLVRLPTLTAARTTTLPPCPPSPPSGPPRGTCASRRKLPPPHPPPPPGGVPPPRPRGTKQDSSRAIVANPHVPANQSPAATYRLVRLSRGTASTEDASILFGPGPG